MICVDSSVAVKWIFAEELSELADALFQHAVIRGERLVAPPLLPIEVTNVVRQRMRRARSPEEPLLSLPQAMAALHRFLALPIELTLLPEIHLRALELAGINALPAVYDAHDVALAELLGCDLWTADQALVNRLQRRLPFVRWLGDFQTQRPAER